MKKKYVISVQHVSISHVEVIAASGDEAAEMAQRVEKARGMSPTYEETTSTEVLEIEQLDETDETITMIGDCFDAFDSVHFDGTVEYPGKGHIISYGTVFFTNKGFTILPCEIPRAMWISLAHSMTKAY